METPAMRYHEVLARPSLHEVADLEQQRIKAQKQAAKRADIQHKMQKLQKQLADLNAKPI
jgi:hypothetical protein